MRWLKILGLVLLIIVGAVSLLAWWIAPHVPNDQKLVQEFSKKRPDLERLVSMLADDSRMTRIAPHFLWTEDSFAWPRPKSQWGISQVRWDEYKHLFRRAGVDEGTVGGGKSNETLFLVYTWGIVPSGISVGYLHCGQPTSGYQHAEPACIERKDSGKGMYGQSTSFGYRYKKITGDWFILEQSN
jgi:hypothetical protein